MEYSLEDMFPDLAKELEKHKEQDQTQETSPEPSDRIEEFPTASINEPIVSPPETQPELQEQSEYVGNEQEIFDGMSDTILRVVRTALHESNDDKRESAKILLGDLLRARERYYFALAQTLNPDIEPVSENQSLYKIAGTEIYGSLTSILDARPSTENHRVIAEALALPEDSAIDTLQAQEIQPHTLESHMVLAGSSSQERVQQFWADMDLAEHITITANSSEEAARMYATALQVHAQREFQTTDSDGTTYTIFPTSIFAGGYIYNGVRHRTDEWKIKDIVRGSKTLRGENGKAETISLDEMCNNPQEMYLEYICATSRGDAFPISKIIMAGAKTPDGQIIHSPRIRESNTYQDVYFQSPENFDLTSHTLDPETFTNYLSAMAKEVRQYTYSSHPNELKRLKRLYNFCKVQGDFSAVEEISQIFEDPACHMYQLAEHLDSAKKIAVNHNNPHPLRIIRWQLIEQLKGIDHSQAEEALQLLYRDSTKKAKGVLKNIVNDTIAGYIANNESIQNKIVDVLRLTGGNNGYK